MAEKANVTIITDGACSGNHLPGPQPGGWAAKLRFGSKFKEIAGYEERTSNNRMEMQAPISAIEKLKVPCNILIRTDSKILCNAVENMEIRAKNGWKTKTGAKCANVDLHKKLYELKCNGGHEIRCEYVQGHSGDEDNERVNFLAQEAIRVKGDPLDGV